MPKLESYDKSLDYSYCLGVFPCLELMAARPERVRRLLLAPEGEANEGVAKLKAACQALAVRWEYAPKALARLSRKENCYAALVFDKYDDELSEDAPHVVLHHVSDGGNLGTVIRTCLGFGIQDLAIIRPAVDFFDPHVLRASMGAAFRLRLARFDSFEAYRRRFGGHALYPFMLDAALPLEDAAAARREPYALIFGNEGAGLPPDFAGMGQSVVIPHGRQIDSLNLSVAAALGIYAFAGRPAQQERPQGKEVDH